MLLPSLKIVADALARITELRVFGLLSLSCDDVATALPLLRLGACRVETTASVDPQRVRALLDGGALHGTFSWSYGAYSSVACPINDDLLKTVPPERLIASLKLIGDKQNPENFSEFAELKVDLFNRLMCS